MKCEKCGKNEVSYYYKETVNGKTTEKRLCADCAREEGLDHAFETEMDDMFRELDCFFSPSLFLPRMFAPVFADSFRPLRAHTEHTAAETEEKAPAAPETEDRSLPVLRRRREANALRHQLREAVRAEDFETAITLRDKLKLLENEA